MRQTMLVFLAVFASMILLTQIVPLAEGKYSDARKKAQERNEQLLEKEKMVQLKKLDPSTTSTASKTNYSSKTSAEINAVNTAYLKSLDDAKTNLKQAKENLNLAERALQRDSSNSAKKQAVEDAKTAIKQAETNLQVVLLNRP